MATEEIVLSHRLGTWSGVRLGAWTFNLVKEKNDLKTRKLAGCGGTCFKLSIHLVGSFRALQGYVVKPWLKNTKQPGKLRFVTVAANWARGAVLAALSSVVFPFYR